MGRDSEREKSRLDTEEVVGVQCRLEKGEHSRTTGESHRHEKAAEILLGVMHTWELC